jgi:hypothetical protein
MIVTRLSVDYCGDIAEMDVDHDRAWAPGGTRDRRTTMAKGQLRSNKEAKKPKKEKPKTIAAAPSVKDVTSKKK